VVFQATAALSVVGIGLTPLFYAVGYDVFRKYLKEKLFKSPVASATSAVPGTQQTRSVRR